jgi:hypothetical protein
VLNASLSALTIKERQNIEHFGQVVNRLKVIEGFSASPMATMRVKFLEWWKEAQGEEVMCR